MDSNEAVAELNSLRTENQRLIALLESHGIDWHIPVVAEPEPEPEMPLGICDPVQSPLNAGERVVLFRRLF